MTGLIHTVSVCSFALAGACVLIVLVDVIRRPQHMWIMNLVWPLTITYSSVIGLVAYFAFGRSAHHDAEHPHAGGHQPKHDHAPDHQHKQMDKPFWQTAAVGTTHCGSGCALADAIVESVALASPAILAWSGLGWLWHERTFAVWTMDYFAALLLGLIFQYFAIVPMRKLSPGRGIVEAFKADFLSLTAWQIGMYAWMAAAIFAIFVHGRLTAADPVFWFMMQIAMLAGFVVSYPVNWWLITSGIKEKM